MLTGQQHDISKECLPRRKFNNGPSPTITTAEAIGPIIRKPEESKFNPPERAPTEKEKKVILFHVVRHGIYTVMTNHTYMWNRSYKLQLTGGPIGDLLACQSARLYMVWFDRNFAVLLASSGIALRVYKRYVDDGWLKAGCVPPGYRWDQASKKIIQVMRPIEDSMPPDQRTALTCCHINGTVDSRLY